MDALDPDQQVAATVAAGKSADDPAAVAGRRCLLTEALEPLATNPELRNAILDVRKSYEQTIDEVSKDEVLFAGHSPEAREKASALVASFREYIEEHKDEIRALQVLYSRPHKERLTFSEIKELARAIERPPRQWTPDILWQAYEVLDQSKVRGSGGRMLTDIVSLVRYTLHQDDELVPFRDQVEERFAAWLAAQEQKGVAFTRGAAAVADLDEGEHRRRTRDQRPSPSSTPPSSSTAASARQSRSSATSLAPLMNELTEALAA